MEDVKFNNLITPRLGYVIIAARRPEMEISVSIQLRLAKREL
jgi:hypothetical protein